MRNMLLNGFTQIYHFKIHLLGIIEEGEEGGGGVSFFTN